GRDAEADARPRIDDQGVARAPVRLGRVDGQVAADADRVGGDSQPADVEGFPAVAVEDGDGAAHLARGGGAAVVVDGDGPGGDPGVTRAQGDQDVAGQEPGVQVDLHVARLAAQRDVQVFLDVVDAEEGPV